MDTTRRDFIKTTTIAIAGSALLSNQLFASPKKIERLGIQLYTVRDAMKVDPKGSLTKLADMGYIHVEHANYIDRKFYGYTAKEFKKLLADLLLQMPSGHCVMKASDWDAAKNDFTDKWKYTIDDAVEVGQRYVISPWLDENLRTDRDALKRFMDQFNKCGELCKKSGLTFGYHNHNFEFTTMVGDITLYDYILTNTDPNLVAQQFDVGHLGSNATPLDILKKYPGRFELMHVKDVIKNDASKDDGGYESTTLGDGILPVKEILKAARKTGGTSQFIIEQEQYQGKDPFDCVKIDLQRMKKWGY